MESTSSTQLRHAHHAKTILENGTKFEMVVSLICSNLFLIYRMDGLQDTSSLKITVKTPSKKIAVDTTPPPDDARDTTPPPDDARDTTPPPDDARVTAPPPDDARVTTPPPAKKKKIVYVKVASSSKQAEPTTHTENLKKIKAFNGFKFGEDEKMKVHVVS
jgi:hypothetical protein